MEHAGLLAVDPKFSSVSLGDEHLNGIRNVTRGEYPPENTGHSCLVWIAMETFMSSEVIKASSFSISLLFSVTIIHIIPLQTAGIRNCSEGFITEDITCTVSIHRHLRTKAAL